MRERRREREGSRGTRRDASTAHDTLHAEHQVLLTWIDAHGTDPGALLAVGTPLPVVLDPQQGEGREERQCTAEGAEVSAPGPTMGEVCEGDVRGEHTQVVQQPHPADGVPRQPVGEDA